MLGSFFAVFMSDFLEGTEYQLTLKVDFHIFLSMWMLGNKLDCRYMYHSLSI